MDWMNLLAMIVACFCSVDLGISIERKDKRSIVFNTIVILLEWVFALF